MDGALACHAAASVDAASHLVDVNLIRVELQVFLSPFLNVIPLDWSLRELHDQIERDLFASIVFQLRKHLDWHPTLGANSHELPIEIADSGGIYSKEGAESFDSLGVV
jgi:hypothetical protein